MEEANTAADGQTASADEPGFFERPAVRSILERNVGVYLTTGIGLLLAATLTPDLVSLLGLEQIYEVALEGRLETYVPNTDPTRLFVGIFMIFIVLLIGPVMGALLGVVSARSRLDATQVASANAIGAFAGYALMFVLVFLLVDSQASHLDVGFGSAITSGLALALPSGVVCGATSYLVNR